MYLASMLKMAELLYEKKGVTKDCVYNIPCKCRKVSGCNESFVLIFCMTNKTK